MARLSGNAGLEALRQQQIEIAQRIKAAETKAREKAKADQDRREKLAGRVMLAHMEANPEDAASDAIRNILTSALTRPADLALFDLGREEKAGQKAAASDSSAASSPLATSGIGFATQET